jgi:hypothetical protein
MIGRNTARVMGILAVMTVGRADTLLEQGYTALGGATPPPPPSGIAQNHVRFRTEALVYAGDADVIRLAATCVKIGRYGSPLTLKLLPADAASAEPETRTVPPGETVEIAFSVTPRTVRRLVVDARRNAYTLRCLNGRLAFPAEIGGTPFHCIRRAAPIYFFVPEGARRFQVKLEGEGVGEVASAKIFLPGGAEAAKLSTLGTFEQTVTVDVPTGADNALWRAEAARIPGQLFEDFTISFAGDVVPYVSESPTGLLAPLFGTSTSAVAWQVGRDPAPDIKVRLHVPLAENHLRLAFSVRGPNGNVVQEETVDPKRACEVVLNLSGALQPGEYAWAVSAIGATDRRTSLRREGIWVLVPRPKQMTADDGVLCNGKPFFPRGLYHVSPEDYALVAAHGFNCVQTSAGVPPTKERAQSWCNGSVEQAAAAGLKSCVALYWSGRPNGSEWRRQFEGIRAHPGVLAWMIQDEPDGRLVPLEEMARSYAYIRANDPERPAYTCLCRPTTYGRYGHQTDYMSLDVYPIGRAPITQIAVSLERAQHVMPRVPFWFIGQIWPWPKKPNVTPAQHRCMTYLALTHGARGLMWYSFRDPGWYIPEGNPPLWDMMRAVNTEVAELEPFLLRPNTWEKAVPVEGEDAVHVSLKRTDGRVCVIAVNPADRAHDAVIPLGDVKADTLRVQFEDRSLSLADGVIRDHFAPLAVHVYIGSER